jgi:hypothetical protein
MNLTPQALLPYGNNPLQWQSFRPRKTSFAEVLVFGLADEALASPSSAS